MPHESPAFLTNTATLEIEEILDGEELNLIFAIGVKGNIRRVYSSHFDINRLNTLKNNSSLITKIAIKTDIPKCEIVEVLDSSGQIHGAHCPCCHSGGKCRTCD